MSDHAWVLDNVAAYCTGGLTADERERLERHTSGCHACAKALADERALDQTLNTLFTAARPKEGWESRVIENLRTRRRPRQSFPWRWLLRVAAVLVLGLIGAGMQHLVANDYLLFPGQAGPEAVRADRSYWGDGNVIVMHGTTHHGANTGVPNGSMGVDALLFDTSGSMTREDRHGNGVLDLDTDTKDHKNEGVVNINTYWGKKDPRGFIDIDGSINSDHFEGKRRGEKKHLPQFAGVYDSSVVDEAKESKRLEIATRGVIGGKVKRSEAAKFGFGTELLGRDQKTIEFEPPALGLIVRKADGYYKLTELAKLDPQKRQGQDKDKVKADNKTADALALGDKKAGDLKPGIDGRKIIRTGEIEFEVDAFDAAVEGIKKLIAGVKGAFVETINSDKLPNGKVRGAAVVRVPPESLDKFLLDLRRDFAKTGELKSQKIGSRDVGKEYTDFESSLRAARVIEERLLGIIKTGKGEVKDLIAAESELGKWRTVIEKMEGEIRYYNNQIALSTLKINLAEKEIRAAAALVLTEQIRMRVEVDDVEKQQKEALDVFAKAKGRVLKSELKREATGQLEAILQAEVAPERAAEVRKSLEQLGQVTKHEAERVQQAEGGSGGSADIKTRKSDVIFQVAIYNTANIPPREIHHLTVATRDVPGGYKKLHEAAKGKGQVREGKLQEQDKLNISAQLDFDVPTIQKDAIDKLLVEVGQVLARSTDQQKIGETATDRKVGYRLSLKSVAGIAPREKFWLGIEVKDVDKTAAELMALAKANQGGVGAAVNNLRPNGQGSYVLLLDVPHSAKDELLRKIKAAGTVREQRSALNPEAPESELATVHFHLTLNSAGPIVPSDEGLWPLVRTSLFYSFKALAWSLSFIILGLCVAVPWALLVWAGYKVARRWWKKPQAA